MWCYVTILLLSFASKSSNKKLKRWENHQKTIPWRCRPTNKLGRHVGLAIGSQCWSATDGHSRTELPKASCLSCRRRRVQATASRIETSRCIYTYVETYPLGAFWSFPKNPTSPPQPSNSLFWGSHIYTPGCIYHGPPKPTFLQITGMVFHHRRLPIKQLSPGFLQSLCLSQWPLAPVDLTAKTGVRKKAPSNHYLQKIKWKNCCQNKRWKWNYWIRFGWLEGGILWGNESAQFIYEEILMEILLVETFLSLDSFPPIFPRFQPPKNGCRNHYLEDHRT